MSSWEKFVEEIEMKISNESINNFLQWKVIKQTMFHNAKFIEYQSVRNSELLRKFPNLIIEDSFGTPNKFIWNRKTSGNLIHHLYSINVLLFFIGYERFTSIKNCYEFGGGYGSFARIISRILPNANYTIYDFEIFLKLQKVFLSKTIGNESPFYSNMEFLNESTEALNTNSDLYIALWSLSESPIEVRKIQEEKILKSKYILIGYQDDFDGIDNHQYFNNLKSKLNPNAVYYDFPIKHLVGSNYLIVINE